MATEKMKKNDNIYCCDLCDFSTCKKTNYDLHLQTKKHTSNSLATLSNTKKEKPNFQCNKCNKIYNDRTGLWRHKKTCLAPERQEVCDFIKERREELQKFNSDIILSNFF